MNGNNTINVFLRNSKHVEFYSGITVEAASITTISITELTNTKYTNKFCCPTAYSNQNPYEDSRRKKSDGIHQHDQIAVNLLIITWICFIKSISLQFQM